MSKLMQSAFSEDESEKDPQVGEDDLLADESPGPEAEEPAPEEEPDSDDLLAEDAPEEDELELPSDGMPEAGDELDLSGESDDLGVPEYGDDFGMAGEDIPLTLGGPNDVLNLVQGTLDAEGLDELLADVDGTPGGGFKRGGEPASPDDEYSVLRSMLAPASK